MRQARRTRHAGEAPADYRDWLHYDPINIAAQLRKASELFAKMDRIV